jgi:uncharacterized protein (TIGR02466 family)
MADAQKIDKLLREATEAMQGNKPKIAIRLARQVLDVAPQSAPALFISGMAENARGRKDVALNFMEMAVKADANVPEIQFNLGVLLGLNGRTTESEAVFRQMLAAHPENVNVVANLGRAQYANRKWADAAKTLRKAAQLMPGHNGIHEQLAASLQQAGDLEAAERSYRTALAISADNPDVHYNLGTVLSRRHDIEGSVSAYKEAIRLNADHGGAQRNLGHLLGRIGRFEEAIEPHRRAARAFQGDPSIAYDLGYALAVTGRETEALKVLGRALEANPQTTDFMTMIALAHFRNGDAESALAYAEQALEAQPGDNTALAYKAMALNELGRLDEARPIYDIDRLVMADVVEAPDGFNAVAEFNSAFEDLVRQHHSLEHSPLNRSLSGGQSTRELLDSDAPAALGFRQIIEQAVARYTELNPVDADHPFLARRPERTEIACWANIIQGGGFQDVHFHPPSWLSGVYYPKLPAAVADAARQPEGWLEFGRAYYMLNAKAEAPVRLVQPEEGLIVLFPAYFGHRTIPFESDEERISVAFDVMPADAAVGF